MESENTDKPIVKGVSQQTKDIFDMVSKTAAILGGIISAIVLIATWNANTAQRAHVLRWEQSKLADDLVNGMLSDSQAFDALRMVDWESRDYSIDGKKVRISKQDVLAALNVANNANLDEVKGIYIRESFDRLFHHLGRIQRGVKNNLFTYEDVELPLRYYSPILYGAGFKEVLQPYMEQLHHDDAMYLLDRFSRQAPLTHHR